MNESEIAAQLATRIPRESPATDSVPVNVKETPKGETGFVESMVIDEMTRYRLMDFLDISPDKRGDLKIINMVEKLAMWAQERGSADLVDMMKAIRMVQQATGKRDLDSVYAFAKLDIMQKKLNDEYGLLMS